MLVWIYLFMRKLIRVDHLDLFFSKTESEQSHTEKKTILQY